MAKRSYPKVPQAPKRPHRPCLRREVPLPLPAPSRTTQSPARGVVEPKFQVEFYLPNYRL